MTLLLTFFGCVLALTAFFWLIAYAVQSYLYSQPANLLPVRAVVCGLLMALFLTGWTYSNTRATHKDKYGTFFDMQPTDRVDLRKFEAVRQYQIKGSDGKLKEETVAFAFDVNRNDRFYQVDKPSDPFMLNSSLFITTALLIPDDDTGEKKSRFIPEMDNGAYVRDDGEAVMFNEEDGSRYLSTDNLHHLYIPSTGALIVALLFNAMLFVVCFGIFWYGLQFSVGPALALTALFGVPTILILMPLLFDQNELPKRPITPEVSAESPAAK